MTGPSKGVTPSRRTDRAVTLAQTKRSVEVYRAAAGALLAAGHPGQASARAYYSVHVIALFIAERFKQSVLWPKEPDGSPCDRFLHSHLPVTVQAILRARQARGEPLTALLTPEQAYAEVQRLKTGRMDGDYRPYLDVSRDVAAKRLMIAQTLCQILIAEAEHVDAQERAARAAAAREIGQATSGGGEAS